MDGLSTWYDFKHMRYYTDDEMYQADMEYDRQRDDREEPELTKENDNGIKL